MEVPDEQNINTNSSSCQGNPIATDTVQRLAELLQTAASGEPGGANIDQLRHALSSILVKLGIDAFCYQIIRGPSLMPKADPAAYIITTFRDEWVSAIALDERPDKAPLLARALKDPLPFGWSEVADPEDLDSIQRQIRDCPAASFSLKTLATFPIHAQHDIATLTIAAGKSALNTIQASCELIFLIGHYFHSSARHPVIERALTVSRRRMSLLSPRERQMLEFTAKGLITNEMSKLAGISPKSVEAHLESARKKLNATNRAHAAVKSIMLGLISPDSVLQDCCLAFQSRHGRGPWLGRVYRVAWWREAAMKHSGILACSASPFFPRQP